MEPLAPNPNFEYQPIALELVTEPTFGIYRPWEVENLEEIAYCVNCNRYYYEEIGDERDDNCLRFFQDGKGFMKGCPACETDAYLLGYEEFVANEYTNLPWPPHRPVGDPNEGREWLGFSFGVDGPRL